MFTLTGELDETRDAFARLSAYARKEGITFGVANEGGVRAESDTTRILKYRADDYAAYVRRFMASHPGGTPLPMTGAWDDGKPRPINPFGLSFHNWGAARDLDVIARPASLKTEDDALRRLAELTREHPDIGLRAGRYFPKDRYDPRHFELAVSLDEAKRRYLARAARGSLQLGAVIAVAVAIFAAGRFLLGRRSNSNS